MDRHPIQARDFKEILSHWATTVTIVAIREAGQVHATTVSSFAPVSADPPLIVVSLGANAQVLPWLEPGVSFTVSLLADDQQRLASVFADSYPVGPSPFPDDGDPVVQGAMTALICTVREVIATESDARLVLGRVESVSRTEGKLPLLYHRRGYRKLGED